jgi:ribosomal protein L13E
VTPGTGNGLVGMAERLVAVRQRLFQARANHVIPSAHDVLEEMRVCRLISYYLTAGRGPSVLAGLKAGVSLTDMAAALGSTVDAVRSDYERWITQQVDHFRRTGMPGMTPAEADTARRLAETGGQP